MYEQIVKISFITYMFTLLGRDGMIFEFYQKWLKGLPYYIANPLGRCYSCLTGQACLWYYIITVRPFNVVDMLFYPALGIFLTYLYDKLMDYLLEI